MVQEQQNNSQGNPQVVPNGSPQAVVISTDENEEVKVVQDLDAAEVVGSGSGGAQDIGFQGLGGDHMSNGQNSHLSGLSNMQNQKSQGAVTNVTALDDDDICSLTGQ